MAHVDSDANSNSGPRRTGLRHPLLTLGAVVLATAGFAGLGAAAMAATPASSSGTDPAPLITAAVAVAAAVPSPQAPQPTPTAAPSRSVTVVGDSLVYMTATDQQAELRTRGYDTTVQGNPGKPLSDPWTQGRLDEAHGRDIVVVATASNDNVELAQRATQVGIGQAGDEYAARLGAAMDRVAAPCTVIVDVRTRSNAMYHPETTGTTNARLRQVAARRRAVVVSWSELSASHDQHDWFVGDELHFISGSQRQDAGVQAYTQAIANGVDQCASLLGAQ